MIPIHELLNRIRWDKQFGMGDFVIGYYDRIEDRIIRVPLQNLHFQPENHFIFDLVDPEGNLHSIPLHRVREVFKNGERIWYRSGTP